MSYELKWYVVNTYSGYEDKVVAALRERIERDGLVERFGEIFVPKTTAEMMTKTGKKKKVSKTSYPGYILVQMHLDDQTSHAVKDTPRISGFVGNARNPRPVAEHEVMRLVAPEEVRQEEASASAMLSFEKGEVVKVADGPFTNFDGVVDEVRPDKAKLRVLVSIFGRETPVELDYAQVEKQE